jgi:oligoendopeptidase F
VYQYATCFASAARIAREIMEGPEEGRAAARQRYLDLLAAGGSDYPMELLKRAGVDLGKPETVRAVIEQLDVLVTRLEKELAVR